MSVDPAILLTSLVQAAEDAEGALLLDRDGRTVAQKKVKDGLDMQSVASEYSLLLRQAKALSAELDCGALRRLSVEGSSHRIVFGLMPGDQAIGVLGGPGSLCGQMRHAVAQAVVQSRES